jgi:hypothetical protein
MVIGTSFKEQWKRRNMPHYNGDEVEKNGRQWRRRYVTADGL